MMIRLTDARLFLLPLAALALGLTGCVPYTVATTAHPVEAGEWSSSSIVYFIPNGISFADGGWEEDNEFSEPANSFVGTDLEIRIGIDERSDVGVRAPGLAGAVVNYKRLMTDPARVPAVALMGGGGFINGANHAHFEATAIVSGIETAVVTPYGGLRAMQVIPLSDAAPSDDPTLGAFGGLRIGQSGLGVAIEVGVFYDPSATGIRENDWIVVPSVTLIRKGFGFGRMFPF